MCAFVSLLTGFTVPSNIAITGETTLRGKVTAVGGIKEKVSRPYLESTPANISVRYWELIVKVSRKSSFREPTAKT